MPVTLDELSKVATQYADLQNQAEEMAWKCFLSRIDNALLKQANSTPKLGSHNVTFSFLGFVITKDRIEILQGLYPGLTIVPGSDCWGTNISFRWSAIKT